MTDPKPLDEPTLRDKLVAIQLAHETSYAQKGPHSWRWSCSCGEMHPFLPDRDACHKETREHWADVILASLRREGGEPLAKGATVEEAEKWLTAQIDWHDNQEAMADAADYGESAKYHERQRKALMAARTALRAAGQPHSDSEQFAAIDADLDKILGTRHPDDVTSVLARVAMALRKVAAGQPEPSHTPQGESSSDLADQLAEVRAALSSLIQWLTDTVADCPVLLPTPSPSNALAAQEAHTEVCAKETAGGQPEPPREQK